MCSQRRAPCLKGYHVLQRSTNRIAWATSNHNGVCRCACPNSARLRPYSQVFNLGCFLFGAGGRENCPGFLKFILDFLYLACARAAAKSAQDFSSLLWIGVFIFGLGTCENFPRFLKSHLAFLNLAGAYSFVPKQVVFCGN